MTVPPCRDSGPSPGWRGLSRHWNRHTPWAMPCRSLSHSGDLVIINVSGRGDKDLATVMDYENL